MRRLTGQAADAALQLLEPGTRRMVHVLGKLQDIDDRASLRRLVHVHKGDVEAYRAATVERVTSETREGRRGLKLLQQQVQRCHPRDAAETAVTGLLIDADTGFSDYVESIDAVLGRDA